MLTLLCNLYLISPILLTSFLLIQYSLVLSLIWHWNHRNNILTRPLWRVVRTHVRIPTLLLTHSSVHNSSFPTCSVPLYSWVSRTHIRIDWLITLFIYPYDSIVAIWCIKLQSCTLTIDARALNAVKETWIVRPLLFTRFHCQSIPILYWEAQVPI